MKVSVEFLMYHLCVRWQQQDYYKVISTNTYHQFYLTLLEWSSIEYGLDMYMIQRWNLRWFEKAHHATYIGHEIYVHKISSY